MSRPAANRARMLVCGTGYGQRYLQAIERQRRRYELAGVLARGSLRATLLAARHRAPLFVSLDEVPAVDAAVAAMGPRGDEVVLELLRRGVAVVCEHPVKPPFLRQALETARASGVPFHLNAHFAMLRAPHEFIRRCAALRAGGQPLFIDAMLTPRLLYAFLDIMRHAAGPLQPHAIDAVLQPRGEGLTVASGVLGGVSTSLQFERVLPDGSSENVVDCRIAVGFPDGILTLTSLAGPVIWNGNERQGEGLLSETVFSQEGITSEQFDEQRLEALERSLAALVAHARGGPAPPEQEAEHLLDVCEAAETWNAQLSTSKPASL